MSTKHRQNDGNQHGGTRFEQKDEKPELYSIFCGEVASVLAYGAFVKIPGYRKNGLVHKTQISVGRVEDVSEVLAVGDRVFCKVISLGEDDEVKISLSMKVVDQGTGTDLDKNLVQTKQEEQRRKKGQTFVAPKIELGAVFNTVCKKCGTKGHLARDCFQTPGGKSYDLLPDEELALPAVIPQPVKKKKKKDKKKKKFKKRKHRSTTSDSSDSESDVPERSRHHKHSQISKKTSGKSKRNQLDGSSDSDAGEGRHHHKHSQISKKTSGKSRRNRLDRSSDNDAHEDRHSQKYRRTSEVNPEMLKKTWHHRGTHEDGQHHKHKRSSKQHHALKESSAELKRHHKLRSSSSSESETEKRHGHEHRHR